MDDREKLVELLADNCDMKDKRCVGCEEGLPEASECKRERFGKIADHLIAHGVTVQEWIPASEPPKCIGLYLAAGPIQLGVELTSREAFWDGTNWRCSYNNRIISRKVTHWMPLPPAPKGE